MKVGKFVVTVLFAATPVTKRVAVHLVLLKFQIVLRLVVYAQDALRDGLAMGRVSVKGQMDVFV